MPALILAEGGKALEWLLIFAVWILFTLRKKRKQKKADGAKHAAAPRESLSRVQSSHVRTAQDYGLTEGEALEAAVSRLVSRQTNAADSAPTLIKADSAEADSAEAEDWLAENDARYYDVTAPKESAYDFKIQGGYAEAKPDVPFVIDESNQSHFRQSKFQENQGMHGGSFVVGTESEEERAIYDAAPIRRRRLVPKLDKDVLKQFVIMQEILSPPLSKRKRNSRDL